MPMDMPAGVTNDYQEFLLFHPIFVF